MKCSICELENEIVAEKNLFKICAWCLNDLNLSYDSKLRDKKNDRPTMEIPKESV
jgi:hypothetical protein